MVQLHHCSHLAWVLFNMVFLDLIWHGFRKWCWYHPKFKPCFRPMQRVRPQLIAPKHVSSIEAARMQHGWKWVLTPKASKAIACYTPKRCTTVTFQKQHSNKKLRDLELNLKQHSNKKWNEHMQSSPHECHWKMLHIAHRVQPHRDRRPALRGSCLTPLLGVVSVDCSLCSRSLLCLAFRWFRNGLIVKQRLSHCLVIEIVETCWNPYFSGNCLEVLNRK